MFRFLLNERGITSELFVSTEEVKFTSRDGLRRLREMNEAADDITWTEGTRSVVRVGVERTRGGRRRRGRGGGR